MKIAIYTPDVPLGRSIYASSGSEDRWALNWIHLLRQNGHDAVQIDKNFSSAEEFDLFFQTVKHPNISCHTEHINAKRHVHMAFGLPEKGYLEPFECHNRGETCFLAFPHQKLYELAVGEHEDSLNFRAVFLPTPYTDDILPGDTTFGFDRKEITWMLKRVWHPNPNSSHEFRLESYKELGIWTLKAIKKLASKTDLQLNYAQENDYGGGILPVPEEAQAILNGIENLNYMTGVNFAGVLQHMSRSKISISIAGLTGSVMESVFCGCLPLAYNNPVSPGVSKIVPITLTTVASSQGLVLPFAKDVVQDDIYELLEDFWFDEELYTRGREAYLEDFRFHTAKFALQKFNKLVEIVNDRA